MSKTTRIIIAAIGAGVLAALATPSLSDKLPPGVAQTIAVAVAAVLHRIDAESKNADDPETTKTES